MILKLRVLLFRLDLDHWGIPSLHLLLLLLVTITIHIHPLHSHTRRNNLKMLSKHLVWLPTLLVEE